MKLDVHLSADGRELTIIAPERLIFEYFRDFRAAYENAPASVERITVDFIGTRYLDSSAIGMILLLNHYAETHRLAVELANCSGYVYNAFSIFHLCDILSVNDACPADNEGVDTNPE